MNGLGLKRSTIGHCMYTVQNGVKCSWTCAEDNLAIEQ